MNEHEERGHGARTTPSQAEGESGDRESRREAEQAVADRPGDTDPQGADGHAAKRQSPGIGREEQTRPHRGGGNAREDEGR
ncbi:hypothetical protein [Streptomyces sp. NPDC058745]|uniref:hypothetical protein n=1 Tax=Streptomyces sp. NPDC058745 TaxID=3346621 RepID=UPI00368D4981